MHSLPQGYSALVVGGGGAIGAAVATLLRADARCVRVWTTSRQGPADGTDLALDLADEPGIAAAAAALRAHAPLHLVFIATGVLTVDGHAPEKRLAELDPAVLARAFAVNATGPALLVKHLHDLLPVHGRSLLAVLSARVGSIGDNRLGGWYAYRASKAALNMLLRTAAIEVARRRPQAVLAALHPGTVRSPLSAPVVGDGTARGAMAPDDAARRLLAVLDALPAEGASGSFHAWDGQPLPW
jgi:NAD(P)-dependent dehydrogenase (short-subunit alcohol dehydrogenase family)